MHIGDYCKPHENDEKTLKELERSLSLVNVNPVWVVCNDQV